ncbi:MAG: DUF4492 domain-containing protein [Sulfurovum sp.]|nr:MAG: DUF4492 domain-containing protein [Sulfurovum sp.]RUM70548.1 MAG: DUF4492 domain-containing protein [Sulfurovum sp.]RUM77254.1 MAG: DUF4492 domain-containing protein [Sulfurovum sp.]
MYGLKQIYNFYYEGFKRMKIGKKLWLLIIVKVFILFVIIKWIFFPDILKTKFDTDAQRSAFVLEQLMHHKEK